jgi:glycosyltransferase involved in cell wall biosynthesis
MTESSSPKITAVIPAFNEEKTIGRVVQETLRYVSEVVVVDDGSTDTTRNVALTAGATVLAHSINQGYGDALATGFEYVKNNGANIMVILDGDGQHNPADITRLAAPIISGQADIVLGSRFISKGSKKDVPAYRRFGIGIVNKAWNMTSSEELTDTQCGFRAYSRNAIDKIDIQEAGMSASLEILDQAGKGNLKLMEVPVKVGYEGDTSTQKPTRHGMELVNYVLKKLKEEHPLLIFGGIGLVVSSLGLVFGIIALNGYFDSRYLPFGPTIIAGILIYVGTLMIFGGLILNSIQSIASRLEDKRQN